jgi:hypothetical protein
MTLWRYDESFHDRLEVLKRERLIVWVERLHVPLIDEATGQLEPRSVGEGIPRVGLVRRDLVPVPSGERAVMPDDMDDLGANVRSENFRGDLRMSSVTENLADVVEQSSENDLVIGAGALRTGRDLQSVLKLADVSAITHRAKRAKQSDYLLSAASGSLESFHTSMIAHGDGHRAGGLGCASAPFISVRSGCSDTERVVSSASSSVSVSGESTGRADSSQACSTTSSRR